jgi:hypothetical protein
MQSFYIMAQTAVGHAELQKGLQLLMQKWINCRDYIDYKYAVTAMSTAIHSRMQ